MNDFGEATGRQYKLFEYIGDPKAERVIVSEPSFIYYHRLSIDQSALCTRLWLVDLPRPLPRLSTRWTSPARRLARLWRFVSNGLIKLVDAIFGELTILGWCCACASVAPLLPRQLRWGPSHFCQAHRRHGQVSQAFLQHGVLAVFWPLQNQGARSHWRPSSSWRHHRHPPGQDRRRSRWWPLRFALICNFRQSNFVILDHTRLFFFLYSILLPPLSLLSVHCDSFRTRRKGVHPCQCFLNLRQPQGKLRCNQIASLTCSGWEASHQLLCRHQWWRHSPFPPRRQALQRAPQEHHRMPLLVRHLGKWIHFSFCKVTFQGLLFRRYYRC